jgi:hypothetical protein
LAEEIGSSETCLSHALDSKLTKGSALQSYCTRTIRKAASSAFVRYNTTGVLEGRFAGNLNDCHNSQIRLSNGNKSHLPNLHLVFWLKQSHKPHALSNVPAAKKHSAHHRRAATLTPSCIWQRRIANSVPGRLTQGVNTRLLACKLLPIVSRSVQLWPSAISMFGFTT